MKKGFYIEGKKYIRVRDAAKFLGYDPDYISRLCREGQLQGLRQKRGWIVQASSLEVFAKSHSQRKEARQASLSEELRIVGFTPNQPRFAEPSFLPKISKIAPHRLRSILIERNRRATRARILVTMIGICILTSGVATLFHFESKQYIASSTSSTASAASSLPTFVYEQISNFFCAFSISCRARVYVAVESMENIDTRDGELAHTPVQLPSSPTVIERVIENVRTISFSGVTETFLNARLAVLTNRIDELARLLDARTDGIVRSFQDGTSSGIGGSLEDLTILDSSWTNGTITNAAITGGTIASLSSALPIGSGGTGTSTSPTYGQLLLGQSDGSYSLVATSTLGISSGSSFDYLFPNDATSTLLTFSGGLRSTASTTIGSGSQAGGLTISGGATTTGWFLAQNSTDSTTGFQIKDADGGTPIFNVDTTNEFVGIWASSPNAQLSLGPNLADQKLLLYDDGLASTRYGFGVQAGQFRFQAANNGRFSFINSNDSSEVMSVYATGNVGIGTTSPYAKLSVVGPIVGQTIFATTTGTAALPAIAINDIDTGFSFQNSDSTDGIGFSANGTLRAIITAGGTGVRVGSLVPYSWSSNSNPADAISDTGLSRYSAGVVAFGTGLAGETTGGFLAMASSTIGGGTQARGLTVSGGATTTGNLLVQGTATSSFAGILSIGSTTPGAPSLFSVGTSSPLLTVNKSTGFVGVGTANPSNALHVEGTIRSTSGSNGFTIQSNTAASNADPIEIRDLNTSNANAHLGLFAAGSNRGVYYIAHQANDPSQRFFYGIDSDGLNRISYEFNDFALFTGSFPGTERARFTSAGKFGIGTTSPATLLSLAGTTGLFASTTATSTFQGGGINLLTAAGNTGCFAVNGTCLPSVSDIAGDTFRDWSVQGNGYLAPTTTRGILVNASSTIGFGTQAGGLSVSGGATTTGFLTIPVGSSAAPALTFAGSDLGAGRAGLFFNSGVVGIVGNGSNIVSIGNGSVDNATSGGVYSINGRTAVDEVTTTALQIGSGYTTLSLDPDTGASPNIQFFGAEDSANIRMTIQQAGNVGIGTTSPYAKLSVVGPVAAQYFHATSTTATSTFSGMLLAGPNASVPSLEITENGRVTFGYQFVPTDDYVMRVDKANDEILVGNTLQFVNCCGTGVDLIQGSSNVMIVGSYWDETQSNNSRFGGDSSNYFSASTLGYLKMVSGGTERVSIAPTSGNVGVGTTSPYAKLSVEHISTTGTVIGADALTGFTGTLFDLKVASSTKFFVNASGGVVASASSTIGAGGQTTGLTISGGATTTGNARFEGTLTASGALTASSILTTAGMQSGQGYVAASGHCFRWNTGTEPAATGLCGNSSNGNVGIGTSTPFAAFSVNSVAGVPGFVVGSSTATSLIVDASGNVGLGTTSPYAKLSVVGPVVAQYFHATSSAATSTFTNFVATGNASTTNLIVSTLNAASCDVKASTTGVLSCGTDSTGGGTPDSKWATSTTDALAISPAGALRVGIGTTTPYFGLTVASTTGPQLSLSAGTGIAQWVFRNAGANLYLATTTVAGTATTTLAALTINGSTGNVGIGTTTPADKLDIYTDSDVTDTQLSVTNSSNDSAGIRLNASGSGKEYRLLSTGSASLLGAGAFGIYDSAAAAYRLVINSSGNVGIGTTTPSFGRLTIASTTGSQLSLSAGAGLAQWAFRNAGGNLYLATTTVAGTATTTLAALTINGSTGNVGIGTTSPASKLHIASSAGTTQLTLDNTSGSSWKSQISFQSTSTERWSLGIDPSEGGVQEFFIYNGITDSIPFFIDGNDNVGIGTTEPDTKLTVVTSATGTAGLYLTSEVFGGNVYLRPNMAAGNNNPIVQAGDSGLIYSASGGQNTGAFVIAPWTSGAASGIRMTNTGLVGIGTTTPVSALNIYGDTLFNGTDRYANFGTTTGTSGYGFRDNAGALEFKNMNGSWRSVTTATSGPSFSVHKNGTNQTVSTGVFTLLTWSDERFDTNNNFDLSTERFTPTVSGKYVVSVLTQGTSTSAVCAPNIYKNGSIYQGIASLIFDIGAELTSIIDMNGSTDYLEAFALCASGTTVLGGTASTSFSGALIAPTAAVNGVWSISDQRLKENIATTSSGLDLLASIPVHDFNLRGDADYRQQGFIAQELYEYYPDAVVVGGDNVFLDPWLVDYGRLTPLLVKAIQDLNLKLEDLATTTPLESHGPLTGQVASPTSYADRFWDSLYTKLSNRFVTTISASNDIAPLSATTSAAEIVTSSLSVSTSTPWVASFATSSQMLSNGITSLGDTIVHVLGKAMYAVTGIFDTVFTKALYAENVFADTVTTNKLCLEDVCVTKAELQSLLSGQETAAATSSGSSVSSGGDSSGSSAIPAATSTEPTEPPAELTGTSTPAESLGAAEPGAEQEAPSEPSAESPPADTEEEATLGPEPPLDTQSDPTGQAPLESEPREQETPPATEESVVEESTPEEPAEEVPPETPVPETTPPSE